MCQIAVSINISSDNFNILIIYSYKTLTAHERFIGKHRNRLRQHNLGQIFAVLESGCSDSVVVERFGKDNLGGAAFLKGFARYGGQRIARAALGVGDCRGQSNLTFGLLVVDEFGISVA